MIELETKLNQFKNVARYHKERPFKEVLLNNGHYISFTPDCPPELAGEILALINESGLNWFSSDLQRMHSRRRLAFKSSSQPPFLGYVIKEKATKLNDPTNPEVNVAYFTKSVFHEMRASYRLAEIINSYSHQLHHQVEYQDEMYDVVYQVQLPLAGIVNTNEPNEKFTIFQYLTGQSPRDIVAMNGGWNNVDESLRKLYGQLHQCACQLSKLAVAEGLEPYDLGVHQFLYRFDHAHKQVVVSVLDCEEYRFYSPKTDQPPKTWPSAWDQVGLPPVLVMMSAMGIDNTDD